MPDRSVDGLNSVSQSKTNSLFLYPKSVDWNIEPTKLVSSLNGIGFINDEIPDTQQCFFTGEQFLNHITFLGCAPSIQFIATDEKPDFCFIRIICSKEIKAIHTRTLARAPHCPHCKKPVQSWHESDKNKMLRCTHCQKSSSVYDYDWRRTAGFARVFIEVTEVYPKEAIPQPSLLEKLASLTDVEWDYFYYCA